MSRVGRSAELDRPQPSRLERIEDRQRWNRLVEALPHCALEQGWEWGEVLRASAAAPHRYGFFTNGRCIGAIAMLSWRAPVLGVSVLYAPRGPVLEPEWPAAWAGLRDAARLTARATGAICLRVSPGVEAGDGNFDEGLIRQGFTPLPDDWTIWNSPKIVMAVSLDGPKEAMWDRISNRRRREIRAATAAGVRISHTRSPEDVTAFHRLVVGVGQRKRYPVRPLGYFEALWQHYAARGDGVLALAHHEGRLIGGLLGARLGTTAYLLYSAVDRDTTTAGSSARAGPLLYWDFLQWATTQGCHVVQWGGSGTRLPPDESDPGYGVYQFKRSFGSSCFAYLGYYDLVFRPGLYRAFRLTERRLGPMLWRLRARLNPHV